MWDFKTIMRLPLPVNIVRSQTINRVYYLCKLLGPCKIWMNMSICYWGQCSADAFLRIWKSSRNHLFNIFVRSTFFFFQQKTPPSTVNTDSPESIKMLIFFFSSFSPCKKLGTMPCSCQSRQMGKPKNKKNPAFIIQCCQTKDCCVRQLCSIMTCRLSSARVTCLCRGTTHPPLTGGWPISTTQLLLKAFSISPAHPPVPVPRQRCDFHPMTSLLRRNTPATHFHHHPPLLLHLPQQSPSNDSHVCHYSLCLSHHSVGEPSHIPSTNTSTARPLSVTCTANLCWHIAKLGHRGV